MKVNTSGIAAIRDKLQQLQRNAESLPKSVTPAEVLTDDFLKGNTPFDSLGDMLRKSPFKAESLEDLKDAPDEEWDKFVSENTRFSSWKDLVREAAKEFARRRIFEGK